MRASSANRACTVSPYGTAVAKSESYPTFSLVIHEHLEEGLVQPDLALVPDSRLRVKLDIVYQRTAVELRHLVDAEQLLDRANFVRSRICLRMSRLHDFIWRTNP